MLVNGMKSAAVKSIIAKNDYNLFDYLCSIDITPDQFEIFRHVLFARVYLTIPSICKALENSLLQQDYQTVKTCFKNLEEELAEPNHQVLMEQAFNFIAKNVFNLKSTTLLECYLSPRLSEEIIYRYTVRGLYSDYPVIASMCQELSSGGTETEVGMMGKMYQVFYSIYEKSNISKQDFKKYVLPYFAAHLAIDSDFKLDLDPSAVEYQHGLRAIEDFERIYKEQNTSLILAFSEVQNLLFNATLKELKSLMCLHIAEQRVVNFL